MVSVPFARLLVVHFAVRNAVRATAEQPVIVVPLEVNATVPVGTGGPAGPIVAVKVTAVPNVDGFLLEVSVVVEVALVTVTEVVPLETASLAPSPLKQPTALFVPTPPSLLPVMPAKDAVAWPLPGTSAEVPSRVPLQAVPAWKATVPRGGAKLPRPVAVTVAVSVVVPTTEIEVGLAARVVVLAKGVVTVFQSFTRFATFTLPRPVAAL